MPTIDRKALAERLRMQRARLDLTQREVAEAVGINTVALCNYERGRRRPNLDTAARLARFYQVSLDWLVGYERE